MICLIVCHVMSRPVHSSYEFAIIFCLIYFVIHILSHFQSLNNLLCVSDLWDLWSRRVNLTCVPLSASPVYLASVFLCFVVSLSLFLRVKRSSYFLRIGLLCNDLCLSFLTQALAFSLSSFVCLCPDCLPVYQTFSG